MIKVGITGGIGSGKSLICQVFSKLGVPVYNADDAAKYLMDHEEVIKRSLTVLFGSDLYPGGKLNRQLLADLIYKDQGLLIAVNRIVHPRVGVDFMQWCSSFIRVPFVIQESAILFESSLSGSFDYILHISAPEELRIQRVLNRPGMSREKIQRIIMNQLPEEEKILRSHFNLKNDGKTLILPGILKIFTELSNKQHNDTN